MARGGPDPRATKRPPRPPWLESGGPRAVRGSECRSASHALLPGAPDPRPVGRVRSRADHPQFAERGFGPWAVEVPGVALFAGYVGLLEPTFDAEFTPCVEIGWRLAFAHWGRGYATEAARAVVEFGFSTACLQELVSFTVPANRRSIAVMESLGMTFADEFDHPRFPAGHPLRRHVLYRLARSGGAWTI